MAEVVPIYDHTGRAIEHLPVEYIEGNAAHFVLSYSPQKFRSNGTPKPRHLRHAMRRQRLALVPLSNNGNCFEQQLESGHVYALKGVPGSERETEVERCA